VPNQIRSALILPADWKVEAPQHAPGEFVAEESDDAETEAHEDKQEPVRSES
jgi:hypothetical protein